MSISGSSTVAAFSATTPTLQTKKRTVITVEQQIKIRFWQDLINNEITIFDYMFYHKISELVNKALEQAKLEGIYKQKVKQLLNQIKADADHLVTACTTSEKLDLMEGICYPFPIYRSDYMKEGGSIASNISFQWKRLTDENFIKLYYTLNNIFGKYKIKHTPFCCYIYMSLVTCQILEAILDAQKRKMKENTGVEIGVKAHAKYTQMRGKIVMLCDMLIGEKEIFSEYDHNLVQVGGQVILDKSISKQTARIITDALRAAVKDYTEYCISRMLLNVRNYGYIDINERAYLFGMKFTEQFINGIQDELIKTKVGQGETDPHELKMLTPNIKFRKHLNALRRVLVDCSEAQKELEKILKSNKEYE